MVVTRIKSVRKGHILFLTLPVIIRMLIHRYSKLRNSKELILKHDPNQKTRIPVANCTILLVINVNYEIDVQQMKQSIQIKNVQNKHKGLNSININSIIFWHTFNSLLRNWFICVNDLYTNISTFFLIFITFFFFSFLQPFQKCFSFLADSLCDFFANVAF